MLVTITMTMKRDTANSNNTSQQKPIMIAMI